VLQQERLAIFDTQLGLFNETVPPHGLPQNVDLARHAAKVARDVTSCTYSGCVPADEDMYCVIDWETYAPYILDHGRPGGCPGAYTRSRYTMPGASCAICNAAINASKAAVLRKEPALNATAAIAAAVANFNAAARKVWTKTLEVARQTRPRCRWGFYGKPGADQINFPFVDANDRAVNDAYQWIYDISDALYPSTYMHYNGSRTHNNSHYVQTLVREAERVNANRKTAAGTHAPRIKVLPWVWYRYLRFGSTEKKSLLAPQDMHTALEEPGLAGADGILLYEDGASWGPSPAQKAANIVVQVWP
jgi:hypothetical protein